jgi:hypothetical protein
MVVLVDLWVGSDYGEQLVPPGPVGTEDLLFQLLLVDGGRGEVGLEIFFVLG